MTRLAVLGVLVLAGPVVSAQEVMQLVIAPESSFTFLPSPGFVLEPFDCQPDSLQCDFDITGTISVSILGDTLTFPSADLQLVGNEAVQSKPPGPRAIVTEAKVAEVLNTVELMRVAPELYQLKERGFLHEPLVGPPLEVAFKGNQLRMTGGEDRTGGDGIGYFFDVHAVLVPEPSGALHAAIGLGVVYARRRRNATSRMTRAAS